MNGSSFKRKLKSGATVWCYSFYAGRDVNGKPINLMKGGFETKGAAETAKRDAIAEYEKTHGTLSRHRDALGTMTWSYSLGEETKSGFAGQGAARTALAAAMERRAAAERVPAEVDPTFAEYINYWLDEHASRRIAPKTLERYREFAAYLIRHLGETRLNDLTTAQIQRVIHNLQDHGGMVTKEHPAGRPLAAKTVRHLGTLLYTSLAEADRLGVLKIPHPMRNKWVRLPKLPKRKPAVVEKEKFKALLDRARSTRLYPFIVLASATGCRRGELLAFAVAGPERFDRRTQCLAQSGTDEGGPACEVHQIGRAAQVRHTGPRHFGARRAPRGTGERQADVRPRLPGPRIDLLPAERCLLLAGSRGRPRQGVDGGGRIEGRQPPFAQAHVRLRVTEQGRSYRGGFRTPRPRRSEHHLIDLQPRNSGR